jgi:type IV pilus assembly protein PilW
MTNQNGLSLVELMIGLTIGILMLTVLSALLVSSSNARTELDQTMQQVENGRYATQLLASELRHAGYYGEGSYSGSAPAGPIDPCATTAADLRAALPLAVQGYSQEAASPIPCLDDANFSPGTDILIIRRAQTNAVDPASLDVTTPYVQSAGQSLVLNSGDQVADFSLKTKSGSLAAIHPYVVQIYFVSPCTTPAAGQVCTGATDDSGHPRPALKRLELTSAGWQVTPLVEGIEYLVVEYGIDADNDGAPEEYKAIPADNTEWANVVAVRMNLLARNVRETSGYSYKDEKTYNLGAVALGPYNDRYKRHAYSEVVRLMNISGRREN